MTHVFTISSDPESPIILSPNILLTQKQGEVPTISGEFSIKDRFYTDLIRSTYKIGTTIRPEDLDWSSNSRDTTQCIDKARTTHL
jgi:hypothetical protein